MSSLWRTKRRQRWPCQRYAPFTYKQFIMPEGVRQVDQILAEFLMAQFTRVNLMMGEDLNTSLQELFSVVEELGKTLLTELKTAPGPTVSNLVPYNLQRVVESHNSCLYMSLTKVLVFMDCARQKGRDFLEDRVKSLQSDEEFKKFIISLSEWISAFEDCIWELALSEELAEEEVALRVNLALTATRPVVGNYFSKVLEGLGGDSGSRSMRTRILLTPPRKVWSNTSLRSSSGHPHQPFPGGV